VGQTVIETTISRSDAVEQAEQTAPLKPVRLFSSDLPRCADLAHGLGEKWSIPVHLDPRLREMNFGEWEGRHYDAIEAEDGERWHTWCTNWRTQAPPAGESLETFTGRVSRWLEDQRPTPTDAIVTHAGVIRVLRVLGGMTWDDAMASENPFLGWTAHTL